MEYLYTDHSPIEDSDSIGILELANQYVMPRLTALCELYISKHVERATSESIAQADVDIIGRPFKLNMRHYGVMDYRLGFINQLDYTIHATILA